MRICVDIDQTISSGFLGASVAESLAYYRARQVAVPADARRYQDFFGLPEVIRIHEEIPGARAALHSLANAGHTFGYFTVRHSDALAVQEQIRANTRLWLVEHQFPQASNVSFFAGMPAKLYEIGKQMSSESQPVVMIDDSWEKVLNAYERIQGVDPLVAHSLVTRLVLLAFGTTQNHFPATTPLQVRALPNWKNETIKEVFNAIHSNPGVSTC